MSDSYPKRFPMGPGYIVCPTEDTSTWFYEVNGKRVASLEELANRALQAEKID